MSANNTINPFGSPRFQMHVLRSDRRFAYAVANPAGQSRGVLVLVHDTERRFLDGIHAFASFAQLHRLAILAPLFPPNVLGDDDEDGYKFLLKPGLRYDHLLLDMVRAVENRQGLEGTSPLLIHGYSGGAQFAHRFALLHPLQVFAVSVSAPGEVTLADNSLTWWAGVGDTQALFGGSIDWDAVARVHWHLSVGEHDVDTSQLQEQPPSAWWPDDCARLSANRQERLRTFQRSLEHHGVASTFELLPAAEHHSGHRPASTAAQEFFARCLTSSHEREPAVPRRDLDDRRPATAQLSLLPDLPTAS